VPPASPDRPADENASAAPVTAHTGAQPTAVSSDNSTVSALKAPARNSATKSHARSSALQTPTVLEELPGKSNASLELAVQHQFRQATLSLWIDNKLALTRPLHGNVRST